jgi:hypothetical protein
VFTVLAPCQRMLEKWNMIESQQVLEWMAAGEARGELRGKLQVYRTFLRDLLEARFGALPEALTQRIEATTNPERLREAHRQSSHLGQLDDLQL